MKKGFTLIELLAVIIILAVVALIATPIVLNVVNSVKDSVAESQANYILDGAKNYYSESMFDDNKKETIANRDNIYEKIKLSGRKPENGELYINSNGLTAMALVINNKCYKKEYDGQLQITDSTNCSLENIYDPNAPILFNKMIPVEYENNNWIYANINEKWYDYDNQKWANAVVLNNEVTKNIGDTIDVDTEVSLMYVWIPRYKYTIFNGNDSSVDEQEIKISFEHGTSSTGHPAFCFGHRTNGVCDGDELTGIWVGKFEINAPLSDSNTIQKVTIKPNVYSWVDAQIAILFTSIANIRNDYGINADSHMIKNMEWGVIAYLTQSKYGRCDNGTCTEIAKNDGWYTGRSQGFVPPTSDHSSNGTYTYEVPLGQLASTTGNIYGIYDMSGGGYEWVMGNMVTSTNVPMVGISSRDSGFKGLRYDGTSNNTGYNFPESKYYDAYTYNDSYKTHSRGRLGDATKETLVTFGSGSGGWYSDSADFIGESCSWFFRGGRYAEDSGVGIFSFNDYDGSDDSSTTTRAVLVSDN